MTSTYRDHRTGETIALCAEHLITRQQLGARLWEHGCARGRCVDCERDLAEDARLREGYVVMAPSTPGATPTAQGTYATHEAAYAAARDRFAARPDLRGIDVEIRRHGHRVAFAGPSR